VRALYMGWCWSSARIWLASLSCGQPNCTHIRCMLAHSRDLPPINQCANIESHMSQETKRYGANQATSLQEQRMHCFKHRGATLRLLIAGYLVFV